MSSRTPRTQMTQDQRDQADSTPPSSPERDGGVHSIASKFREFGRDTILYGITDAVGKSMSLILLPVYTRLFTPAEYGVLDVVVITGTLLNLFMQLELNTALSRYFYEAIGADRRKLVSTLFWAVLVLSGGTAAAGLVAAGPAAALLFPDGYGADLLRIVVGTSLGASLLSLASMQLRLERRIGRYSTIQLLHILLSGVLSVGFVAFMGWGLEGALWGTFCGSWLSAVLAVYSIRGTLVLSFDKAILRRALRFSLPTLPGFAAGWVRRFGDRFVILFFLSTHLLGIYALGARVAMIPSLLIHALTLSWTPFSMSLLGDPHQREIYERSLRYYALVLGVIGLAVSVAAPEILSVLGTQAYQGGEVVIGWIVGAKVIEGAGLMIWIGAMVKERTEVNSIASWVGAIATLAAMALLVPILGIEGAAVGVFAGALAQVSTLYLLSQRLYPLDFAVNKLLVFVALYVVSMVAVMHYTPALQYGWSLAARALVVVLFAGLGYFGLLGARERVFLLRAVRGAGLGALRPTQEVR